MNAETNEYFTNIIDVSPRGGPCLETVLHGTKRLKVCEPKNIKNFTYNMKSNNLFITTAFRLSQE